jgi:chemotaxis signal transduction protein
VHGQEELAGLDVGSHEGGGAESAALGRDDDGVLRYDALSSSRCVFIERFFEGFLTTRRLCHVDYGFVHVPWLNSIRTSMAEYLVFQVGEQSFGVAVSCVREVVRAATLSASAAETDTVEGLLNLRGGVVPVVDLGRLLKFQTVAMSASDYLVVLADSRDRLCAVRSNSEVQLTSEAEVVEHPGSGDPHQSAVGQIRVGRAIVPLLNPDRLIEFVGAVSTSAAEFGSDATGDR